MMLLFASLTQQTASLQFTSPPFRVHLHPLHLRCIPRRAVKVQASKAASDRLTEVSQAKSAFDRLPLSTHAAKVLRLQIQDALKLKQVKLQQLVKDEDYQQVLSMLQSFHTAYLRQT